MWKQPWLMDLVRSAAVPAALALIALLVYGGIIKPAIKDATAPPLGGQVNTVVADPLNPDTTATPGQNAAALPAPGNDKRVVDAIELAKSNPAAVAHIVRDWVNAESA